MLKLDDCISVEKIYKATMKLNEIQKEYTLFTYRLYTYYFDLQKALFVPI